MMLGIFNWKSIRVTPDTLFQKQEYKELTKEKRWEKAIDDGWRFDGGLNKFYRLVKLS